MIRCLVGGCSIGSGRTSKVTESYFRRAFSHSDTKRCDTGVDSNLPDNFGRSVMYGLSALTTFISITFVGGLPFFAAVIVICAMYWSGRSLCLSFSTECSCFSQLAGYARSFEMHSRSDCACAGLQSDLEGHATIRFVTYTSTSCLC